MYDCLNIVTEPAGRPSALLVRAVEPIEGIDAMRAARLERWRDRRRAAEAATDASGATEPTEAAAASPLAVESARLARLPAHRLASGPGLVAAAFSIDRTMTGLDLLDPWSPLRVESAPAGEAPPDVVVSPRVGIAYAGEPWTSQPWRFAIAANASVSGPTGPRATRRT